MTDKKKQDKGFVEWMVETNGKLNILQSEIINIFGIMEGLNNKIDVIGNMIYIDVLGKGKKVIKEKVKKKAVVVEDRG